MQHRTVATICLLVCTLVGNACSPTSATSSPEAVDADAQTSDTKPEPAPTDSDHAGVAVEPSTTLPPTPLAVQSFSSLPRTDLDETWRLAARLAHDETITCLIAEGFSDETVNWYTHQSAAPPIGLTDVDTGFGILETTLLYHSEPVLPDFSDVFQDDAEEAAFWEAEAQCLKQGFALVDKFIILVRPNAEVETDDPDLLAALAWYEDIRNEIQEQVQQDTELAAAKASWVDCMDQNSFGFGSRDSMFQQLQQEADTIVDELATIPSQVDQLDGLTPAEQDLVLNQIAREVQLRELSDTCDVPITKAEHAARQRIETQFVAENELQLGLIDEYLTALYAELTELVDN